MTMPRIAFARTPILLTSTCAVPAPMPIPNATGRNAKPALIGLKPSTSWTYRVAKKNSANRPPATSSSVTLATARLRILKMLNRTSGPVMRDSTNTKAASSATPTAARPSVRDEPQPKASALTIA